MDRFLHTYYFLIAYIAAILIDLLARYLPSYPADVVLFLILAYFSWKAFRHRTVEDNKLKKAKMESNALKKLVESVERHQGRAGCRTLRSNLMVPKGRELHIYASWNMTGCADEDITFAFGQGCCGAAFDSGHVVVGDLQRAYDLVSSEGLTGGTLPWGITKDQFQRTSHLKSVLSIPLVGDNRTLGVLNLDDTVDVDLAKFRDSAVLDIVGGYAAWISSEMWG